MPPVKTRLMLFLADSLDDKTMAYSDFTLENLETKFGIKNRTASLFENLVSVEASLVLKNAMVLARELPLRTEKSKSEWIVVPLLVELRDRNQKFFTIYSGENLNVDVKKGLRGECDFILAKEQGTYDINYPILQVVEAKKNDMDIGIPQCAAQMLGAKIFNEKKGRQLSKIYGCVTTGNDWIFMVLENDIVTVDNRIYYLTEIELILGAFQTIIDFYKKEIK